MLKKFQSLFGKKEDSIEELTLMNLSKGCIFDYDLSSWEVLKAYEYDWGNHNYSREYKVNNGKDKYYMNVEEEDDLQISFNRKLKIGDLDTDIRPDVQDGGKPPRTITYKGKSYLYDKESPGYYREIKKGIKREDSDWEELIAWTYLDKEEETIITIEQWGEDEFELYYGFFVKENRINNLLPNP